MNIIEHQRWPDGTRVEFTEEARQRLTHPLGPVGQVYTITNTDNSHHDVILRETGQCFGVYWLQAEAEAKTKTDTRSPAADRQNVNRTPEADQNTWIQTFTGKAFPLLNPKPEDIDIVDVARALPMQCRFNGHVKTFYSVAEHCVLMSEAVAPKHALWALLHDASEAYVGDVVTPLKNHLPNYRSIEFWSELSPFVAPTRAASMVRFQSRYAETLAGEIVRIDNVTAVEEFMHSGEPWSDRLEQLLALRAGWLDGTGSSVRMDAIQYADRVMTQLAALESRLAPRLFPTPDGGVQIEVDSETKRIEITISPELEIEGYGLDTATDGDEERILTSPEEAADFLSGWSLV